MQTSESIEGPSCSSNSESRNESYLDSAYGNALVFIFFLHFLEHIFYPNLKEKPVASLSYRFIIEYCIKFMKLQAGRGVIRTVTELDVAMKLCRRCRKF